MIVILLAVFLIAGAFSQEDEDPDFYYKLFEEIDPDMILDNKRVLNSYLKCFYSESSCTTHAQLAKGCVYIEIMDGMQLNLALPPEKPKFSNKKKLVNNVISKSIGRPISKVLKKSTFIKNKSVEDVRPKVFSTAARFNVTTTSNAGIKQHISDDSEPTNEFIEPTLSFKQREIVPGKKRRFDDVNHPSTKEGDSLNLKVDEGVSTVKKSKWFVGTSSSTTPMIFNLPERESFHSAATKNVKIINKEITNIGRDIRKRTPFDFPENREPFKNPPSMRNGRNNRDDIHSEVNIFRGRGLFSQPVVEETLDQMDVEPLEEQLFSSETFQQIEVHPHLVGNLKQLFGIEQMTVVQKKTIPVLMSGKDALVRSQTGSGKTLAYAIPVMESLQRITPKLTRKDGLKALVILPTRELATQTYECFMKLMRAFTWIVPGLVIGGEKRKSEKVRLRKGITVLIGTPGRLLDHAKHTGNLTFHHIDWLIVDEADKLLELGYEKDISELNSIIEQQRQDFLGFGRKQTVLLSATLTSEVEKLASSMLKEPVFVETCGAVPETTDVMIIPQTLKQKFVVVPAKLRLVALSSFLVNCSEIEKSGKMLVFMAGQDMVDFYTTIIGTVIPLKVPFFKLHGNMSQTDRSEVFNSFRKSESGVLFCTDVAARGLDFPQVDWILQFTAPTSVAEYVHRVGRTARVGLSGSALLFLLPSEMQFVSLLNSSRIKLDETTVDSFLKSLVKIRLESKVDLRWPSECEAAALALQQNFERTVLDDEALHELACKAFKSWVRFYATYNKELRVIFSFKKLHLGHNAKSFALQDPPKTIGGIGKPKKGDMKSAKVARTRLVKYDHSKKRVVISEFDSGLKPTKK